MHDTEDMTDRDVALRSLPSVEEVLQSSCATSWLSSVSRASLINIVRNAIADVRGRILANASLGSKDAASEVRAKIDMAVDRLVAGSLRPVINATGVILHTNLGRAPLGADAVRAIMESAVSYTNLEYDLGQGRRGNRDAHCADLLKTVLGAPAVVVNNNAAAVFLVLNELARGGEVVISRGEMVEIGDGFRIPDILEASAATLREVGTTNRTRIADYRNAITARTKALIRIHPSNFRQIGFTGRPALNELVALGQSMSIPVVEDLGSGCLFGLEEIGIDPEPTVADSLTSGVDVVTFSGDKLLGGPQAGIVAGRPTLIARIRRNPLFRALRVDKITIAALSETLRTYVAGRKRELPVLRLACIPEAELKARANRFVRRLEMLHRPIAEVVQGRSLLGGGSTPMQSIPSFPVSIDVPEPMTVQEFEANLRKGYRPVISRIEKDRVLLDLRTVFETEEDDLLAAVLAACDTSSG